MRDMRDVNAARSSVCAYHYHTLPARHQHILVLARLIPAFGRKACHIPPLRYKKFPGKTALYTVIVRCTPSGMFIAYSSSHDSLSTVMIHSCDP